MNMRLLLLLFLALTGTASFCQDFEANYYPLHEKKLPKTFLKSILKTSETAANARKIEKSSVKSAFIKNVKELHKSIAALDTERTLMFNDTISVMLNRTVNSVIESNPLLKGKTIVIMGVRDEEVNAANCGPGIILVNLGLIAHSFSYEEMVFTLCHEIAHEYLDHCFEGIEKTAVALNDPELKRKYRKIRRSEYNSQKQAELLFMKLLARLMVHEREQEYQADSLGLLFYNNMGFDKKHALHDMMMLDSSEVPYYHKHLDFQHVLDPNNAFFEKEWLTVDTGRYHWSLDSTLWFVPDSLKTHPDCKNRVNRMEHISAGFGEGKPVDQSQFLYFQNLARFEMLDNFLVNEDYANSLYYALQLLEQYPNNVYLHNVVLNSLIEMGNALKDHRFSEVVDHPHELYYPDINRTLHFLHHLNSGNFKKMAVAYFNAHLQTVQNDAFTGYNAILIKAWETPKEKLPTLIDVYKTSFTDKYYLKKLQTKFKKK